MLYFGKKLHASPSGGRELLCKLNYDALHEICGDRLVLFELPMESMRGVRGYVNAYRGYIDGLSEATVDAAIEIIRDMNVEQVFVDGSNLGEFVAVLKRRLPAVEVITFFHNVEARFFWGAWRQNRSLRALGVIVANTLAERKAVKYSDKVVSLSERDSRLLRRLYGRGATNIAPMVMEDKCPVSFLLPTGTPPEQFALFVGGTFYANRQGISWFVREVAPRIDFPVYVVGRGFEAYRADLEVPGKVIVVGEVDSLADWYHRAQFVIAPIFDGSGMKTKVAEALMYGKKIMGTTEAFSGYENVTNHAGWMCDTVDEFVGAIELARKTIDVSFDFDLRDLYEQYYSMEAARTRLMAILNSDCDDAMGIPQ